MKTTLIKILTLVSVLLLSACAAGPTFKDYEANIPALSNDIGRIYVYRPSAFGAAVKPRVWLNDEEVGQAVSQGFFFVDRPAGDYKIATSTEAKRSLSFTLEPGSERYVRLEVKMGLLVAQIKPVLVENEVGKKQIEKTKYIGE